MNIEETRLKQRNRFKYLGVVPEDQGRQNDELREIIGKLLRNVGMLYQLQRRIKIPSKVILVYKTIL